MSEKEYSRKSSRASIGNQAAVNEYDKVPEDNICKILNADDNVLFLFLFFFFNFLFSTGV